MVTGKRVMDYRAVDTEFDGKWVLLDKKNSRVGEGCLVAYGDGTPEDRDALDLLLWDKYNGKALLKKGYIPKDEVYVCGTITEV
jgi:hypothetical protein